MTRKNARFAPSVILFSLGLLASSHRTTAYLQSPESSTVEKETRIWYLGHSGWAIRTKNHLLVFDYEGNGLRIKNPVRDFGAENRNLWVFVSHEHRDHFTPDIFEWEKANRKTFYILGLDFRQGNNLISLGPREKKKIADVEILTIKSTDLGVGFLVNVDGLAIFHAGDFENGKGLWESYVREVVFLKENTARLAMAFIPVARNKAEGWTHSNKGSFYLIRNLAPKVVFPMHALGQEKFYKEFAKEAAKNNLRTIIHCAEKPGDSFIYP